MTNGEKLQSIFPYMEWEVKDNAVLTDVDNGLWFGLDWWNAEYKEPSKGEKTNGTDKEIHGVREELKAIEKELHNLNRILEKRKI